MRFYVTGDMAIKRLCSSICSSACKESFSRTQASLMKCGVALQPGKGGCGHPRPGLQVLGLPEF